MSLRGALATKQAPASGGDCFVANAPRNDKGWGNDMWGQCQVERNRGRTGRGRKLRFRQIAQLPHAPVGTPVREAGRRGHAGRGPTVRFRQIAQLPDAIVRGPIQAGASRVGSVASLRLGGTPGQEMRVTEHRQDTLRSLPPGTFAGGQTVRSDGVAAGIGLVSSLRQGGAPGQMTQFAECRQDSMIRETVLSDGVAAGIGLVSSLRQGGALGRMLRSAEPRQDSMIRETVPLGGADGGVRCGTGQQTRYQNRRPDTMQCEMVRLRGVASGPRSGLGLVAPLQTAGRHQMNSLALCARPGAWQPAPGDLRIGPGGARRDDASSGTVTVRGPVRDKIAGSGCTFFTSPAGFASPSGRGSAGGRAPG